MAIMAILFGECSCVCSGVSFIFFTVSFDLSLMSVFQSFIAAFTHFFISFIFDFKSLPLFKSFINFYFLSSPFLLSIMLSVKGKSDVFVCFLMHTKVFKAQQSKASQADHDQHWASQ